MNGILPALMTLANIYRSLGDLGWVGVVIGIAAMLLIAAARTKAGHDRERYDVYKMYVQQVLVPLIQQTGGEILKIKYDVAVWRTSVPQRDWRGTRVTKVKCRYGYRHANWYIATTDNTVRFWVWQDTERAEGPPMSPEGLVHIDHRFLIAEEAPLLWGGIAVVIAAVIGFLVWAFATGALDAIR